MERLGESSECGQLLAGLLVLAGWELHPSRPALGGGRLWIATRTHAGRHLEVRAIGDNFAQVATGMLQAANRAAPPGRPRFDTQLTLPMVA